MAAPALAGLRVADPAPRWEALGFEVVNGIIGLDGVRLELGGSGEGITAWSVQGIEPVSAIDGLLTVPPEAPAVSAIDGLLTVPPEAPVPPPTEHPNGASALDHVVVVTPDFDRTAGALEQVGMPLRRIHEVGAGEGRFRQGFRRLGPAILELVEARDAPAGPARFWGLVVIVADLDALGGRLGQLISDARPAVQPGRRIATLRATAGLSPRVAFMDPDRH